MGKPQSRKLWFILGALITIIIIIGGLNMFKIRTDEERRNHEYEVSLVKALKNSYAGIEEIKITDPNYTDPPGDWSCDIEITFQDNTKISYRIGHYINDEVNYEGRMKGKTNEEINENWDKLYSHKGKTSQKIKVTYSDGEKGEQ